VTLEIGPNLAGVIVLIACLGAGVALFWIGRR
jgi:uncharacterized membrane protein YdjX (TVP38/TMEM64 family)